MKPTDISPTTMNVTPRPRSGSGTLLYELLADTRQRDDGERPADAGAETEHRRFAERCSRARP